MDPITASVMGPSPVGEAQILMLRTAMDMAVRSNAEMLAALPPPPAPDASGARGGRVDAYA